MLSLSVSLKVKDDQVDVFLDAIEENRTFALRDDVGCLQFEIGRSVEQENHFHIYEVYEDASALEEHRRSRHFKKWREIARAVLEEGGLNSQLSERIPFRGSERAGVTR